MIRRLCDQCNFQSLVPWLAYLSPIRASPSSRRLYAEAKRWLSQWQISLPLRTLFEQIDAFETKTSLEDGKLESDGRSLTSRSEG
jgi:hypothetical protein